MRLLNENVGNIFNVIGVVNSIIVIVEVINDWSLSGGGVILKSSHIIHL
jgi:hypothetical protein